LRGAPQNIHKSDPGQIVRLDTFFELPLDPERTSALWEEAKPGGRQSEGARLISFSTYQLARIFSGLQGWIVPDRAALLAAAFAWRSPSLLKCNL
jgi:hypothetical protein